MKKTKILCGIAILCSLLFVTTASAEQFEYLAGSKLDLPHNGNVYGAYRKFNYNTPYNVYIWDLIEDVPRTSGKATLTVHLQKKGFLTDTDVSKKSITVATSTKNSIIEFQKVGKGTYRYWHSTHNGSGNDGTGRFKSSNVGIYSKQL